MYLAKIFKIWSQQLEYNWPSPCWLSFKSGYFQPYLSIFFSDLYDHFDSLFEWNCVNVCVTLETGEKKAYIVNFQNFIKAVDMNLTGNWSIKLRKGLFSAKYNHYFRYWFLHFHLLFGGHFAYVCHNLRV